MLDMIEKYYKVAPAYANRRDVRNAKKQLEMIVSETSPGINGR